MAKIDFSISEQKIGFPIKEDGKASFKIGDRKIGFKLSESSEVKFALNRGPRFGIAFTPMASTHYITLGDLNIYLLNEDVILALDLFQLGQLDGFAIGTIDSFRFNV